MANIKIKTGHTTSEMSWLMHLTQNSCTGRMTRWLVMRFTSSFHIKTMAGWQADNDRLCAIEPRLPVYGLKEFRLQRDSSPGLA